MERSWYWRVALIVVVTVVAVYTLVAGDFNALIESEFANHHRLA